MSDLLDKKLVKAFVSWVIDDNDEKAAKGARLEKYSANLPIEFKRAPSNLLYRCILVSDSLLEKVKTQDKPLVLRNRKYSSWTYDLQAAKNFSEAAQHYLTTFEKTFIILRKSFPSNQIILNIEAFGRYLGEQSIDTQKQFRGIERFYVAIHVAQIEKEIAVKNISSDFTFVKHNILFYKQDNQWKPFK
jgi:hypothetical protein